MFRLVWAEDLATATFTSFADATEAISQKYSSWRTQRLAKYPDDVHVLEVLSEWHHNHRGTERVIAWLFMLPEVTDTILDTQKA